MWRHARGESLDGPRRCEIPNAGLNRVRVEAGRFHIDTWGDVDHLAGMPPQYGLYAAMVPCIVAALWGSSRVMVTGPANAISLTTLALVAPLASPGSPDYVALVLSLTFMVGLLQLTIGFSGLGRLVEKVPHAVILGFTIGAAVLIANSQVGTALGLSLDRTTSILVTARQVIERWQGINLFPLAVVVSTILLILLFEKISPNVAGDPLAQSTQPSCGVCAAQCSSIGVLAHSASGGSAFIAGALPGHDHACPCRSICHCPCHGCPSGLSLQWNARSDWPGPG